MNGADSSVEINGKKYDMLTGAVLAADQPKVDKVEPERREPASVSSPKAPSPIERRVHNLANHIQAHQRESSRTLNRRSVTKPQVTMKPAIKSNYQANSKLSHKPADSLIKLSTARIEPSRAERAASSLRSDSIKRFQKNSSPKNTVNTVSPQSAKSIHPKTGRTFDIARPKVHQHQAQAATPASLSISAAKPAKFDQLLQSTEQTRQHRYLEYKPVKQRRGLARLSNRSRRLMAFSAISLAIVLLAGFIFLEEKNHIELQLADAHAGINATLPSWRPDGFSVSHFNYQPGQVAINYESGFDGHHYKVIQSSSGLDSSALARQLDASGQEYQTLKSAGRTIYSQATGTGASATWVSGGILYHIEGNASLSGQQITRIASST